GARVARDGSLECVDEVYSGSQRIGAWVEAVERRVAEVGDFAIAGSEEREFVAGGVVVRVWERLSGRIETALSRIDGETARISVNVSNTTKWSGSDRGAAQRNGFMSAHIVLRVRDGAF